MQTINVYQFSELSKEAQQKAIEYMGDNIDRLIGHDWHDPIIEGIHEDLGAIGIDAIDVQYSGFWSQGDGLSFEGEVYDNESFIDSIKSHLKKHGVSSAWLKKQDFGIRFDRGTLRYVHENTVYVTVFTDDYSNPKLEQNLNKIEAAVNEWRLEKCYEFYNRLETYYNESTSEKSIIAELEDNDSLLWLENGEKFKK